MTTILLVEDDRTLREGVAEALRRDGYDVELAHDGYEAERALRAGGHDLVILDLMLPGPSGLELLRDLRKRDRKTPVLILTARADEGDKVLGLELGADDYVTKPFSLRELTARVRAHLRRSGVDEGDDRSRVVPPFRLGDVEVDLGAFEARGPNGDVHGLSPKEAGILRLLHARAGRAVDRREILDAVWGPGTVLSNRTIDTHVLHLRQKIEADHTAPRYVRTVHGVGYRLVLDGGEPTAT